MENRLFMYDHFYVSFFLFLIYSFYCLAATMHTEIYMHSVGDQATFMNFENYLFA